MDMKEWLLMTWDKAHHIELAIHDAMVDRQGGVVWVPKIICRPFSCTNTSPKSILPSLPVLDMAKLRSRNWLKTTQNCTSCNVSGMLDLRNPSEKCMSLSWEIGSLFFRFSRSL
jgi:hypothetical protein